MIFVNEPLISHDAKRNIKEAVDTGWISSSGKFVTQFEKDFAKTYKVKYAISVANGTAALHVALLALGIGKGDEVIVPAFTMAATWMAVLYTGARPVFVDCELDTFNIDVKQIESKVTSRTKAIMPVHIYGHPCDIETILRLAKKHKLFVIEDAAEAHGARYKTKLAGTFGDIGCFSFYGNKIITTGEGGMIITDDDQLAPRCKKFKDLHHSEKRFIHDGIGYNYRMTNMQAAIGCGELKHLNTYVAKKQTIAKRYDALLKGIPGIQVPKTKKYFQNVYWMYSILIDPVDFGMDKNLLRNMLAEKGIETRDFFYSPQRPTSLNPPYF
jgi:perosamine synthetase